jgi:hypothetical protein
MEQRAVGRLGEWRAGGGHLDLAALGAACGCCGSPALPRRGGCAFAWRALGSIVIVPRGRRLFAWLLLHAPRAVSELVVRVCDTACDCENENVLMY